MKFRNINFYPSLLVICNINFDFQLSRGRPPRERINKFKCVQPSGGKKGGQQNGKILSTLALLVIVDACNHADNVKMLRSCVAHENNT